MRAALKPTHLLHLSQKPPASRSSGPCGLAPRAIPTRVRPSRSRPRSTRPAPAPRPPQHRHRPGASDVTSAARQSRSSPGARFLLAKTMSQISSDDSTQPFRSHSQITEVTPERSISRP